MIKVSADDGQCSGEGAKTRPARPGEDETLSKQHVAAQKCEGTKSKTQIFAGAKRDDACDGE